MNENNLGEALATFKQWQELFVISRQECARCCPKPKFLDICVIFRKEQPNSRHDVRRLARLILIGGSLDSDE